MAVNLADIIVKKNDGATNITWSGLVPSAGSDVPAVFKSQTVGTAPAHQPELRVSAKDSANKAKRQVRITFVYPQIATNTTTGVTSVIESVFATVDFNIPKTMAQSDINESVAQFGNLLVSVLMQQSLKSGFAPT